MKRKYLLYIGLIGICFLYTGSAYMSQFYRLMNFYDDIKVDIITSGYNYLFQALGIFLFILGLNSNKLFNKKSTFIRLLISGSLFMTISQLSNNPLLVVLSGYIFNLYIGIYSAFYINMLSQSCPHEKIGLSFGFAYALGSLGTYLLSLLDNGLFLTSKTITAVYFILISIIISLIIYADEIENKQKFNFDFNDKHLLYLILIVVVMTVINVLGSDLYYSLPVAKDVNWNLIRAFYSSGLIIAGLLIDKNRFIGEVIVVGSLAYPLITTALIGEGMTNTGVLSLSYFFRGFLTVYYISAFIFLSEKDKKYSVVSCLGLLISRLVEAIMSLIIMSSNVPNIIKLIFSSICFIPLLILFSLFQRGQYAMPISREKRLATFADKYELTSREMEIVSCLSQGLSDQEIGQKLFISKNTVRFHISNILKKTSSSSRIDIVNLFNIM